MCLFAEKDKATALDENGLPIANHSTTQWWLKNLKCILVHMQWGVFFSIAIL